MGRRRITRKRAAAVLAPVAAGVTVLGLATGTASAAFVTDESEYTYTNNQGQRVTCLIFSSNDFDPKEDDEARATTFVDGPEECFQSSFASVDVTYLLPDGRPASGGAGGFGEAFGYWEPVADDFRSEHTVEFLNCDFSLSDCTFDVTLVQPK